MPDVVISAGTAQLPSPPSYAGIRSKPFDGVCGYNVKPSNTQRLNAAIGRVLAGSGGGDIGFFADSLTNGWDTSPGDVFTAGVGSWPNFLQKYIAGRTGIPAASIADGCVRLQDGTVSDPRHVLAGTWNQTIPSFAFTGAANATDTFTSTVAGTSASVWYYDDASGATWQISVNGASSGAGFASMTNSGPAGVKRKDLTGFASANNLQCKALIPGAGNMSIVSAGIYNPNSLLFHNLGQAGSYAAGSGYGSWSDPGLASAYNFFVAPHNIGVRSGVSDCDAAFWALGANDIRISSGNSVASVIAAIQAGIATMPNTDHILVFTQALTTTLMTDAQWQAYGAALYNLADTLNIPLLDFYNVVGNYNNTVANGLVIDGQGHFVQFGNAMLAKAAANALT